MSNSKTEFRRMLKARGNRPCAVSDHTIVNRVISHEWYQKSACVMLYLSIGHEVDTCELLSHAWNVGKRVFVPRCHAGGIMDAVEIFSRDDLQRGMFDILEAKAELPAADPTILDLIIVPAMAFDREKNRLGRGAGYYDRFLEQAYRAKTIGICRSDRLFDTVPCEEHDCKMDALITENEIL